LKKTEKEDSEDKSFDFGAGPVATLSSPLKQFKKPMSA